MFLLFHLFFITKITQNQKVNRCKKKRHDEEICKRLDFLVFSDKDDKPSHNPGTNKFFGTMKNSRTMVGC